MEKVFISAQQLLQDSFNLAAKVYTSDYRPNYIVGVWRGGTPVAIAVQELLEVLGVDSDHLSIRTSSYRAIGQRESCVQVQGLEYLIDRVSADDSLLIVDDVHDSGLTIEQIITELRETCQNRLPEIRVATPYFKPGNNQTGRVPDFYLHETDQWIVFPHELKGLSPNEVREHKPELAGLVDLLPPFEPK